MPPANERVPFFGPRLSTTDLVRQAERFSEAPDAATVDQLAAALAKPVARTEEDVAAGFMLERPAAVVEMLEKATRKIGVLSVVTSAARAQLCRRMNILRRQMEPSGLKPLFSQGDDPDSYLIPLTGNIVCVGTLHAATPREQRWKSMVTAGHDLWLEMGVSGDFGACCTAFPLVQNAPPAGVGVPIARSPGVKGTAGTSTKRPQVVTLLSVHMADLIEAVQPEYDEHESRATLLGQIDCFSKWTPPDLATLAHFFRLETKPQGYCLIAQRHRLERFIVLIEGEVTVAKPNPFGGGDVNHVLESGLAGSYVGEETLFRQDKKVLRSAVTVTVTSKSGGQMLVADSPSLTALLGDAERERLEATMWSRPIESISDDPPTRPELEAPARRRPVAIFNPRIPRSLSSSSSSKNVTYASPGRKSPSPSRKEAKAPTKSSSRSGKTVGSEFQRSKSSDEKASSNHKRPASLAGGEFPIREEGAREEGLVSKSQESVGSEPSRSKSPAKGGRAPAVKGAFGPREAGGKKAVAPTFSRFAPLDKPHLIPGHRALKFTGSGGMNRGVDEDPDENVPFAHFAQAGAPPPPAHRSIDGGGGGGGEAPGIGRFLGEEAGKRGSIVVPSSTKSAYIPSSHASPSKTSQPSPCKSPAHLSLLGNRAGNQDTAKGAHTMQAGRSTPTDSIFDKKKVLESGIPADSPETEWKIHLSHKFNGSFSFTSPPECFVKSREDAERPPTLPTLVEGGSFLGNDTGARELREALPSDLQGSLLPLYFPLNRKFVDSATRAHERKNRTVVR